MKTKELLKLISQKTGCPGELVADSVTGRRQYVFHWDELIIIADAPVTCSAHAASILRLIGCD